MRGSIRSLYDFKCAGWLQLAILVEGEFKDGRLGTAAHPERTAIGRKRQTEPCIGDLRASDWMSVFGIEHTERGRPVAAIEHNQKAAVRRKSRRHGQGVERNLRTRRLDAPAAVEQETAVRKNADLFARYGLRGR